MEWASVAVRFALYLDLMLACGLAAFTLSAPFGTVRAIPVRVLLVAGGVLGLIISLVGIVVLTAAMAGTTVMEVDRETLMIATDTPVGTAWIVRMVALVIAVCAALMSGGRPRVDIGLATAAAAFAVAVATLAWAGHGAMTEGTLGRFHLGADIVHLVAAAVWTGSLLGLILLLAWPKGAVDAVHVDLSWRALHGFSQTGTVVVALIIVSGLVNGWLIVGSDGLGSLVSTRYGQLLLAKIAAFAAMVALASLNRFRLTPALRVAASSGEPRHGLGALRLSLAVETALAVLVLALVAWLGTLEPGATIG